MTGYSELELTETADKIIRIQRSSKISKPRESSKNKENAH